MGLANEVKVSAQEYYELFVDTYLLVNERYGPRFGRTGGQARGVAPAGRD